ncbi:MAG: hypothetical protein ACTSUC_01815 [Promethearchaeota archaeon]
MDKVHNEIFIDGCQESCSTKTLNSGCILVVNFTVLASSYSNVSFVSDLENVTNTTWLLNPINFILAPGESYQETFTLQAGVSEQYRGLLYYASCVESDSNVTVHWWFEVLNSGIADTIGIESFGVLFLFSFAA